MDIRLRFVKCKPKFEMVSSKPFFQSFRETLPTTVQIDYETCIKILKYESEVIKFANPLMQFAMNEMQPNEEMFPNIPFVINLIMGDQVYLKFKTEEEDNARAII